MLRDCTATAAALAKSSLDRYFGSLTVVDWLTANEGNLVVDSIIAGELCMGILALPRGRKRTQLEQGFGDVVQTIDCLPWDSTISRRWAKLVVPPKRQQTRIPLKTLELAEAKRHDLINFSLRSYRTSNFATFVTTPSDLYRTGHTC